MRSNNHSTTVNTVDLDVESKDLSCKLSPCISVPAGEEGGEALHHAGQEGGEGVQQQSSDDGLLAAPRVRQVAPEVRAHAHACEWERWNRFY